MKSLCNELKFVAQSATDYRSLHTLPIVRTTRIAWTNKGAILAERGDHRGALECYDKAIALDASIPQAWFNKGMSLVAGFQEEVLQAGRGAYLIPCDG